MRIESGQQLMQHIENGGNLALNDRGELTTQSGAAHFFQKIRDAFRSLTASGRAYIETRNANLQAAMSELVRQDTLINPTQVQANPQQAVDGASRNTLVMNLAMARGLAQLPQETRSAARALAEHRLAAQGLPQNGTPAQAARATREVLESFRNNPAMLKALTQDYSRTAEEMQPMLEAMHRDMRNDYIDQIREGNSNYGPNNNGIHEAYFKDTARGSIRSLNGNVPALDRQGIRDELTALVPDKTMRSFVSYLASQSGMEGSLAVMLQTPDGVKDHPNAAGFPEINANGLMPRNTNHKYDITVRDNTATITLDMDVLLQTGDTAHKTLGGGHYNMTVTVDLAQDMTDKTMPDFTIVNASRTPIQADN